MPKRLGGAAPPSDSNTASRVICGPMKGRSMFDIHPKALPAGVGVGYKPQHFKDILENPAPVSWLEIHAENYMGDGGRPLAQLRHLAERFPISVHGVGLSIGGEAALDAAHLANLKKLCDWLQPASFSEHLAWSTHDGAFLNDLLPLPYTSQTLTRVVDHIDRVQQVLGRRMLLENPSTYVAFAETTWDEVAPWTISGGSRFIWSAKSISAGMRKTATARIARC
jgi:uncharacterized protein (UPF0276 family)